MIDYCFDPGSVLLEMLCGVVFGIDIKIAKALLLKEVCKDKKNDHFNRIFEQ